MKKINKMKCKLIILCKFAILCHKLQAVPSTVQVRICISLFISLLILKGVYI